MKKTLVGLAIAAFVLEVIMAIPLLGATVIIGSAYTFLVLAFTVHLALLVLRVVVNKKAKEDDLEVNLPLAAPIVGVVGNLVAVIPFVGWAMHLATAILYLIELANGKHKA